ncbi:MAG: response regulator [Eubacteriales bacterium]|nr:response regulator [Eubacteriales bacterium]
MNELQKNSAHWRKVLLRINISIAITITIVEIVMSFVMHFQHLIFQETLTEYIVDYIIKPNIVIWGGIIILGIIFHFANEHKELLQSKVGPLYECGSLYDDILNGSLILMLTLSVGTVAYVHYIFRVTVAGFAIPIFLSIIFYSRKICIQTIATSEIMLLMVGIHRLMAEKTDDLYIIEDGMIIMVFILAIGIIALKLIKHMELQYDEILKARQEAEIANQSKSSFLANMSHEIRTPINAIMGMDEMILRTSLNEDILSYAVDIKNASNSLLSIINDILDVSKIESGKMELLPVDYELSTLIHDVYNSVAIRAKDKGIELNLEIDESLPNFLYGDDIRLRQIITNLLSNGVKYTIEGTVTLKIGGEIQGNELLLSVMVKDTGIGIKEEDIPRIQEKFQRVDEQNTRSIEGTGLGMSIAISFLELMGSKLEITSNYGEGSCFSFIVLQEIKSMVPVGNIDTHMEESVHQYVSKKSSGWIAPKAKILVVDDNALNIKVFSQLLKESMIRIDRAESGSECLAKVKQVQYDLIFLDDMMPDMNGLEVRKEIVTMADSQCINTPIIAFTANAIKGAMERYMEAGFQGYLAKPIIPEKMEKLILDFLDEELVEAGEEREELQVLKDRESVQLPEIPGIDWKFGMSVWEDEAMLLELAKDYYDDLPETMERLSKWESKIEEEENMSMFCIKVHALKSASATIGALPLAALARVLEKASKEKNAEKVHALYPYLLELTEEYRENMKILKE